MMRRNHPIGTAADTSQPGVEPLRSWLPDASCATVALDPARWSRRARQIGYWRLVDLWTRHRRLH